MKTLEQLFGWLLFSLSVLMVYGLLSLFLIAPTHSQGVDAPETTDDAPFSWVVDAITDTLREIASTEPTFAQMEWNTPPGCIAVINESDGQIYGTWCPGDGEPVE